jgi:F-type H+-transporting ATPase subunit epsilon
MLTLSLLTPAKKVLVDVAITEVFVPTEAGELNILEGHAALMAILDTGVLKYKASGSSNFQQVAISWGYLEVAKDQITVLAETAETPEMIDVKRAEDSRFKAEKTLLDTSLEKEQFKKYQLKLNRALIRVQVAQKKSESVH